MASYAVGIFSEVRMGPPIVEYLERIDATLAPYGGRFIIHGGTTEMLEGSSPGTLVVIEFPDRDQALGWYRSPAYQEILSLRTDNVEGVAFVIEGVDPDHRGPDVLSRATSGS